ncbi:MAG: hypothetical protein WC145_12560 [Aliarcobacter sp.]
MSCDYGERRAAAHWSEIKDNRERIVALEHHVADLLEEINALKSTDRRAREALLLATPSPGHVRAESLLSFLAPLGATVECDIDGAIRVIFCEETAVPLETIEEAAAHLREHDPHGRISVLLDEAIVLELDPAVPRGGD